MKISSVPTFLAGISTKPTCPQLKESIKTDVAIIGGGITGISTAYLLSKKKKQVALLEKGVIGTGTTGYTTAFLTQVVDTDYSQLIKNFGLKNAQLVWESHGQAIDFIEQTAKQEKIDCDFVRNPHFLYSIKPQDNQGLQKEQSSYKQMGIKVDFKQDDSLKIRNFGFLEVKNQAKFHPLKYIQGLSKIAQKNGAQVFENTEVSEISFHNNHFLIKTTTGSVESQFLVLATYNPLDQNLETFFKKGFYETYVLEVEIPKNSLPEATFEDSWNPYHYIRVDRGKKFDRLIIGGEDHRQQIKIDPEKNYHSLENYLKSILPNIEFNITRKWGGPIIEPIDGLAYIGNVRENRKKFIATGFSGNGMTYGTISGLMIQDLILGRENPWTKLYDPNRIPTISQLFSKGKDFTEEFIGGAAKNLFTSSK